MAASSEECAIAIAAPCLSSLNSTNPTPATNQDIQPPFHLGYRRWLDGLRGVAILAVLAFHFGFLPGGALGVDLFFVLSGFLITSLLVEEWQRAGSISLKQFYLRRGLRLMPAFVVLLLIIAVIAILGDAEAAPGRWSQILVAACYISNGTACTASS